MLTPQASLDHRQDSGYLPSLERDVQAGAGPSRHGGDDGFAAVGREHEPLAAQGLRAHRRSRREAVPGREHGDHLILAKRHGSDSRSGERDHGDIGRTLFETLAHLLVGALEEPRGDVRVTIRERPQTGRHEPSGDAGEAGHAECAGNTPAHLRHLRPDQIVVTEHRPRVLDRATASLGQGYPVAATGNEQRAHLGFERADRPAHGGLRHAQVVGCGRESTPLDDRYEYPELAERHLPWDDLQAERRFDAFGHYALTKLMNIACHPPGAA